jgi:hypothetical protein
MSRNKYIITAISGLCSLSLVACSSKTTPAHLGEMITQSETAEGVKVTQIESRRLLESGKLAGEESALIQAQATVTQIDHNKRTLTLQSAKGESLQIVAGPEIRNFAQISAGDTVNVEYLIAVAFEVRQPTAEELAMAGEKLDVTARAQLGQMPAAGAAVGKIKVAKIEAIDNSSQTITLSGLSPQGTTQVKAKYAENLAYVKVGDPVVITALEALATNVTKVK